VRPIPTARALRVALVALSALALDACSLRRLTADSTADLLHAGSPQFNTLDDIDFAEASAPASLITIESVWRVAPDNEDLLVELVQGYASYGFAFLEDHMERARAEDDEAREEYWRRRARSAYRRGKMFGFVFMDTRQHVDGGPEAVARRGLAPWQAYLRRFTHRDDVPALFWTANAWASLIAVSVDDSEALLDLPFAVAVAERARQLDPHYANGAIDALFAVYHASTPASLGGQPDLARAEFEAALAASHRNVLTYQVLYARIYAVMVQDRALYLRLLQEVLDAGDVMPSERLGNLVAKRRALRYLAEVDALFPPAEPSAPEVTP
jgi:hypothetical protein